jgi:hypothetical protein
MFEAQPSLRVSPNAEHCRWSPEGPAVVKPGGLAGGAAGERQPQNQTKPHRLWCDAAS